MKRNTVYTFTLPTAERCKELGLNHEGFYSRYLNWMLGVCWAITATSETVQARVVMSDKHAIVFKTNEPILIKNLMSYLGTYGVTVKKELSVRHASGMGKQ